MRKRETHKEREGDKVEKRKTYRKKGDDREENKR